MITIVVSLFFGASFITSVALVAAAALAGRVQQKLEAECTLLTVESLHSIAEVELPGYKPRGQAAPVHAGVLAAFSTPTPAPRR
jgi:hypothetical protein